MQIQSFSALATGVAALALVALTGTAASAQSAPAAGHDHAIATAAAPAQGAPGDGEVIDFKFRTPPMNSYGIKSLAELRGRPLLIEFWGTR